MYTPTGVMQIYCMILMCAADLPAKAKVANCVQYNGYYGCNTCNIKGTAIGHTVYWPFDPSATLRTHDEVIKCATEATKNGEAVCIS